MALGVNASGVGLVPEKPGTGLQGGLITHTAAAAVAQTYTPAPTGLYDSAQVTNVSSNTWIRIVITAVETTGTKTYLVAPTQSVSVGFQGADQISALTSVPVTMPIVQGAVEVATLVANTAPGEVVYVPVIFVEK